MKKFILSLKFNNFRHNPSTCLYNRNNLTGYWLLSFLTVKEMAGHQ